MEIDDLKLIKKHYGENMMHLCRELFPTILEKNGLLFEIMSKKFNYSKFLYDDIINDDVVGAFKNLIYTEMNNKKEKNSINKTPKELLDEAGYNLYECKTEEDIQKFKKYYKKGEELCTFRGNRLDKCYVFFAVKKDVDDIKREDFPNPKRQDLYGTSVISIQFTKDRSNTLSIKNRYNHTVENPDATFSNNLDNIIEGLTESFNNEYYFNINSNNSSDFELRNYVLANDYKYYKYNYEVDNIYHCPDNIIIKDFEVEKYDKEKYIIFDTYILDLVDKEISSICPLYDSFIYSIGEIKTIKIIKDKDKKNKTIIINDEIVITLNDKNQIIKYKNNIVKKIEYGFLYHNTTLESISLDGVEKIYENFLRTNENLRSISLPNVKTIGDYFLFSNKEIELVNLLKVEEIGDGFLYKNKKLRSISLPNVKTILADFLFSNEEVNYIDLPKLENLGRSFLYRNLKLDSIFLPEIKKIDDNFLHSNSILKNIDLPKVEFIGYTFLYFNKCLEKLSFPNLKVIEDEFLYVNGQINYIDLPKLESIGRYSLDKFKRIKYLNIPNFNNILESLLHEDEESPKVLKKSLR